MRNLLKLLPFLALPFILQSQVYFEPLGGPPGAKSYSSFKDANGVLYAKVGANYSYQKSFDDGQNWEDVSLNDSLLLFNLIADKSGNIFGKWEWTIYRSSDTGINWTPIFSHEESFDWEMSISPQGDLYINDGIELYKTTDQGNTWEFLDSVSITFPISWHPDGSMYSSRDVGIFRSTGGSSWEEIHPDHMPGFSFITSPIHISINGNLHVRAKSPFDGIDYFVSTDSGYSFDWMNILQAIGSQLGSLTSNSSGHLIYSNTNDVFISIDNGVNWLNINSGIPDGSNIYYIYIDEEQYIYLNLGNDVMYKSNQPSNEIATPTTETFQKSISKPYPNPFSDSFKIELIGNSCQSYSFELKNLLGAKVLSTDFYGNTFEFERKDLPSGIYIYQIKVGNKLIAAGKIVAE